MKMNKPKYVTVIINWTNEDGTNEVRTYNQDNLEEAETLIGLMTGNVTEADLES